MTSPSSPLSSVSLFVTTDTKDVEHVEHDKYERDQVDRVDEVLDDEDNADEVMTITTHSIESIKKIARRATPRLVGNIGQLFTRSLKLFSIDRHWYALNRDNKWLFRLRLIYEQVEPDAKKRIAMPIECRSGYNIFKGDKKGSLETVQEWKQLTEVKKAAFREQSMVDKMRFSRECNTWVETLRIMYQKSPHEWNKSAHKAMVFLHRGIVNRMLMSLPNDPFDDVHQALAHFHIDSQCDVQ